jgi:hypothetical protein
LPPVLALLMTAAERGEEASKTPFYVAGLLLTAFAVVVSAIGIRAHGRWPSSTGAARGVMALGAVLVAATLATAVITG